MTERERMALRAVLLTVLLLLAATTMIFAEVWQEEITKRFRPAADRELQVRVRGDGAEVDISAARDPLEGRARYRFTPENFDGTLDWDPEENRLTAVMDVRDLGFDDEHDSETDLDLLLPRSAVIALDHDLKGGVLRIDGTGLRFASIDVGMIGGELSAEFTTPSADLLRRFDINVKMGETGLEGLGNLKFDEMDINGFAGEMRIDFSGSVPHRRSARIDLEFGSITVIVPSGMGVEARISKWGFLSEVTVPPGWGRDGKYAYSPAARDHIDLRLDIRGGVGEITIVER